MVRRAVALAGVLALVGGLYLLATGVLGADDTGTASAGTQPEQGDDAPTSTAGAGPVGSAAGTTTPPSTSTPASTGPHVPTADDPAVVYIAGDSDAGAFGPYLEKLMKETGVVDTRLDYKTSSGLSRPDFYDWPAHFAEKLPQVSPDIVVVTFGGNDAQGIAEPNGKFILGTPKGDEGGDVEWREEYTRRAGEVMDQLTTGGRTLIWVGVPNDDNPDVTARLKVQDDSVRAAAANRPNVIYIDTWKRFSGVNGGWAEYVTDPRDGIGKDVRQADGFHLNENGAEIIALDIRDVIVDVLRQRGAAI